MKEIFKTIEDYEGLYEISNLKRVKSLAKVWITGYKVHERGDIFLKGKDNGAGRKFVLLSKYGQKKRYYIDELVKKYF